MASSLQTPLAAKLAALAGFIIGALSGSGIWSFALALSLFWLGNACCGIWTGDFQSHVRGWGWGDYPERHNRKEGLYFWIVLLPDMAIGLLVLFVYFEQR